MVVFYIVLVTAIKVPKYIEPDIYALLLSNVEEKKKERINRFYRIEDSYRSLLGDALIRHKIKQFTGIHNHQLKIDLSSYGKPYIDPSLGIHFNITHSGEWVVAAFGEKNVGIDIEEIKPINFEIAKKCFSPREFADLTTLTDIDEKRSYFYDLWTLKESYIKTIGRGLSIPLNSFSIFMNSDKEIFIDGAEDTVFFKQYSLDCSYKLSVCSYLNEFSNTIEQCTIYDLM
ncbi:4'-phosphopantetheinyl transferase superfamily protein [Paenibacillus macerans]|uniref:4'-phosphopantetheinyl transferase family protein n=1 Tax=Paenibacillus macerans TaxID=44252 RepID=UPI00203D6773|nr:4'-phosphopantetheinyl transferase superfamily protein [Paenibacillus macerans]MCM3703247.1 4'-phosphopantetheinyl transferase superfamily protein [Paenibacillus macerans]